MRPVEQDINPFIVPSETSVLLILILVLPLLIMVEISGSLTWIFPEFSRAFLSTYTPVEQWSAYLLVLGLVVAAVLIYYLRPYIQERREGLVDLRREHPSLADSVMELASRRGVTTPLRLLFSPSAGIDVYTMGTHRESVIVFSRGFLDTFREKKDEFQAILYHELAHISSGDIVKTELALGFLYSFFLLGVSYAIMGTATVIARFLRYGPDLGAWQSVYDPVTRTSFSYIANPDLEVFITNLSLNIFTVLITGVILLILVRFILQYRELHADAMAVRWMGGDEPLRRAFARLQAATYYSRRRFGFLSQSIRSILPGYHPPVARREAFLQHPDHFFATWLVIPFTIGIVAATLQHVLARIQLNYPGLVPGDPFVFITIPVTCLSVALLLPSSTARLFLTPLHRFTRSHPIVISQVFMAGFAASVLIDTNAGVLIESAARRLLYLGRDVTISYQIGFMDTSLDPFNPAMGLIIGERYALVVCALLLLSGVITSVLLQATGWRTLFTRPALTLLLVPATFALSLYLLVSAGYLTAALVLTVAGMVVLGILIWKYHGCPACRTRVTGAARLNSPCPVCGFDFGWWIRNPK